VLRIDDLSVRYRTASGEVEALTRISLATPRGSTLALVGESGSGKSTVALAAMGLLPQEAYCPSGRIEFDGRDLMQMTPAERRALRGRRIGLVFQDPFSVLNPSLRIGDQVAEGLIQHRGATPAAAAERAVELLDEVGIRNPRAVAQAYPHELSGGMRQRVVIAMALVCRPELLIADEPTTALDVTVQAQVLGLIRSLQREIGCSVLLITHDFGVVAQMADDVAVMHRGRLVEQGPVRSVLKNPQHAYTKALLDALPSRHALRR
jgi:peptide/nickel transport system ATP-binding protein